MKTRTKLSVLGATLSGIVLTFSVLTSAAQAASTTLFVKQGGVNSGSCPSTAPCATVSYALTQAASGATINVSGTIDDHVTIASSVTITNWVGGPAGSQAILDGTANGIVFVHQLWGCHASQPDHRQRRTK